MPWRPLGRGNDGEQVLFSPSLPEHLLKTLQLLSQGVSSN